MKNVPTSPNKPVLRLHGLASPPPPEPEEDSFLLPPEPMEKVSSPVPKAVTPASKIVHFTSPNADNSSLELGKLQEELAECHESLQQWTLAEAEWSRQRRLFKVMTENVSDLIVLVDRQGHRVWNNPAYSHALGYTTEELAGLYALSEVHPDDKGRATDAFNQALEHGTSQQAEYRMQQKDGAWVHLQTEVVPILNTEGEIDSIVLLAHDITEQKNLNEALAMASTQVSAAGMAEGMARDFDQILTNVQGNLTIEIGRAHV